METFIFKSLVHFCQKPWSLEEYLCGNPFGRDYFPAVLFHYKGRDRKGEKRGFLSAVYNEEKISFYTKQVGVLWERFERLGVRSHSIDMKRVQLLNLFVDADMLLVDESQDMDACQIDCIARQQIAHGANVFIVGDAAQSIYSFRGARPAFLLSLKGDADLKLTQTWRFGPSIANIGKTIPLPEVLKDEDDVYSMCRSLVVPLRKKLGVKEEQLLCDFLLDGDESSFSMQNESSVNCSTVGYGSVNDEDSVATSPAVVRRLIFKLV